MLTLYYHPRASFYHKVLIALYENETTFAAATCRKRRSSSSTWIASEEFSLADCAAAPALFYAATVQPFANGNDHLQAYFDRLMARPSVRRVLDDIPERFR